MGGEGVGSAKAAIGVASFRFAVVVSSFETLLLPVRSMRPPACWPFLKVVKSGRIRFCVSSFVRRCRFVARSAVPQALKFS